ASSHPSPFHWRAPPSHPALRSSPTRRASVLICRDSGLRASEACLNDPRGSRVQSMTLFADDVPAETCAMHVSVEVCTASPVLDSSGTAIEGLYHLAGEFCPREADESLASPRAPSRPSASWTTPG